MRTKRTFLLGTSVLAGVLAASTAMAQEATGSVDTEATQVSEIVVTGSRIRRDPASAPTPLIQVSQEQLVSSGQATVIDYLATIPALSNSQVPSDTTGSGLNDGGLSLANLRSLGSGRTLTLVDGRRHVGSSAGSLAVDVDTIPRLLIQNVEIITGGASSVYGADAVSGVLNFVLKKDFEGLEIDSNYAMINSDGQSSKRVSALAGKNFFDGRLNVYAHAEYEQQDEVTSMDIDWLRRAPVMLGVDADPASAAVGPRNDGVLDQQLFTGVVRLDRPRWGSLTLANNQPGSILTNPLIPYADCAATTSAACYSVDPSKTYWFDGTNARLANFGERVGNTGANRPYNIGGDGENPAMFSTGSRLPKSESQRYQVGGRFAITENISAFAEAKYVTEKTFDEGQPTFFDVYLNDETYGANQTNRIISTSGFHLRYSDNAFLSQAMKDAITNNEVTVYSAPTATAGAVATGTAIVPWARHAMFGPIRSQTNERELQRYVLGFEGGHDQFGFLKNIAWDAAYTYGKVDIVNAERGVDIERFNFAADSVVDQLGLVNGNAGEIVCRVQLINAQNPAMRLLGKDADGKTIVINEGMQDYARGGDVRESEAGRAAIDACKPLNIFGAGNQSAEAMEYVDATIHVRQQNVQENFAASVSSQLWDFWGAGPLGVAVGAEWRKEYTEAVGRDRETGDRLLFLNGGADFEGASYESKELFGELSVPLFRDSMLGEYAELSASYRYSDYTTVGEQNVYGVNLVYRPISDITFKTSFNTSIRVPSLSENFSPLSETYANSFVDPCATSAIAGVADAEKKQNRIKNCTILAEQMGLSYDFGSVTADNSDDYAPDYNTTGGISGRSGGNPMLEPEESESFTFSTVLRPRFIPNLMVTLDYYDIELTNVIASVTAQTAANTCVEGASLNQQSCSTIFREMEAHADPQTKEQRSEAFKIGGNALYDAFIQGSINYAKRNVRGLDFGARYYLNTEDFGKNWGSFDYSINGSWLLKQDNFNNIEDLSDTTVLAGQLYYPRVRLTSSLSWTPNDAWRVTWVADWQTSQDVLHPRDFITDGDRYAFKMSQSGDFMRNDLIVRWKAREDLTVRAGITNIFDEAQAPWLGTTLYSNFDPYGRRFNIGLNYTPW
ncbi:MULTISPECIES: TonB-dependent receptor domain-containing protein [unclassified Brevundimonas]|uniref:TonB-dependent receptor domain-containing protein n=1 Tax=unclassified Brevundimonas TaxID=2622653 RepID=UPI0025C0FFD1|nr:MULTISPECIES: TonB-dependent receptor [unclassified Brevundimonas]